LNRARIGTPRTIRRIAVGLNAALFVALLVGFGLGFVIPDADSKLVDLLYLFSGSASE